MSAPLFIGQREYFPGVQRIGFEGLASDNPLAFKVYDADKQVGGKTMREHLRFAVCYWHGFCGAGADPFGAPTRGHGWNAPATAMARAEARVDAVFEFCSKIGAPFYCFHDVDLAPEGNTIAESDASLRHMTTLAGERQRATGIELLWGIANLCSHPRYANGAATNPDFDVVARAAAQARRAVEATVELGGKHFVFWNGREGYASLLNTDMRREREHLARFLALVRDYGRSIGFQGDFMIEPKPHEPMRHLYDFDAATVIGFLREHGLDADFKLNIEANHATLAGHSFAHDLQVASDAGLLGSVDANCGDANNGWDTVHFPNDVHDAVAAMLVVLRQGGLGSGGFNLDARLRRESTDPNDMFVAHIGGMDTFARALEVAHALLERSPLRDWRRERYASFDDGPGRAFAEGRSGMQDLCAHALDADEPAPRSGRQERYENLVNTHLFRREPG